VLVVIDNRYYGVLQGWSGTSRFSEGEGESSREKSKQNDELLIGIRGREKHFVLRDGTKG
jgi:hypothetical protein